MGWLDGLCVTAGRGPVLDLACVWAPAQGSLWFGVRVARVWASLPLYGDACLREIVLCGLGDWGLGLVWGCMIDVEWMSDVRAVRLPACCARPIGVSR